MHSSRGRLRNVKYSILLVMSELSTVLCDRVLGLWLHLHGRRVSTESCRGGAQAGRQLWRALLDRGRKQRRMTGFLVCATKPSWRTAVENAKSWRHGRRSRDWRRNGRRRRLGSHCGRGGDGVRRRLGPSEGRGGNGVFPHVEFWRFSQNRPPTHVSRTLQNREPDLHQHGGIAEKTSFRRKNLSRQMRSCKGDAADQPV